MRLISSAAKQPEAKAPPHNAWGPQRWSKLAPKNPASENEMLKDMVYKPMYSPRRPGGAISAA